MCLMSGCRVGMIVDRLGNTAGMRPSFNSIVVTDDKLSLMIGVTGRGEIQGVAGEQGRNRAAVDHLHMKEHSMFSISLSVSPFS